MALLLILALPFIALLVSKVAAKTAIRHRAVIEHSSAGYYTRAVVVGSTPYALVLFLAALSAGLRYTPSSCGSFICGADPENCTFSYFVGCEAMAGSVLLLPVLLVGVAAAVRRYRSIRNGG